MPTSPLLKIVLAEDNPHDVLLVRRALADAGVNFDLRVLADGELAVRFIESLDQDSAQPAIDLLLLDVNRPKRDGAEILKQLRATKRSAQTPVVLMTGSHEPRVRESAQRDPAVHYFRKPSTLAEYLRLGAVVRDLLISPTDIGSDISDFPLKGGSGS